MVRHVTARAVVIDYDEDLVPQYRGLIVDASSLARLEEVRKSFEGDYLAGMMSYQDYLELYELYDKSFRVLTDGTPPPGTPNPPPKNPPPGTPTPTIDSKENKWLLPLAIAGTVVGVTMVMGTMKGSRAREGIFTLPGCTRGQNAKVERCIQRVKAHGDDVNPWAVCQSSVGCARRRS